MKKPYRSPLIYNLIKEYKTLSKTFYEKKKTLKEDMIDHPELLKTKINMNDYILMEKAEMLAHH